MTEIPTFASQDDVATRLARSLTSAEAEQVDLLLVLATGAIAETCDKDLDWAGALDPVPTMLRIVCLEVVARVVLNPGALKTQSKTLGAASLSETYQASGLLELSDFEQRLVRRSVHGSNSGSSRPASTATEVYDFLYS